MLVVIDSTPRHQTYTYSVNETYKHDEFALDCAASAHIWFNNEGEFGIKQCNLVRFEGLNSELRVTQDGFHGDFGTVYNSHRPQMNIALFTALHGTCARDFFGEEDYFLISGRYSTYEFHRVNGLYIFILVLRLYCFRVLQGTVQIAKGSKKSTVSTI